LNRRADETPLAAVEQAILRNALFARGGVLYDLGRFDEAIQAYSTATNRYQNEPAAVEAYVQIASCYRRLNKPLEARGTLEQAKLVIERMPADADFTKTTRFPRDEWNTLLQWLSGT
jgi:TolA-binding protein